MSCFYEDLTNALFKYPVLQEMLVSAIAQPLEPFNPWQMGNQPKLANSTKTSRLSCKITAAKQQPGFTLAENGQSMHSGVPPFSVARALWHPSVDPGRPPPIP